MKFNELEKLVITGHDIEFEYNDNKYAIINAPDGYYFSDIENKETLKNYTNPIELLMNTNVNGKNLGDISESMKNITVY